MRLFRKEKKKRYFHTRNIIAAFTIATFSEQNSIQFLYKQKDTVHHYTD